MLGLGRNKIDPVVQRNAFFIPKTSLCMLADDRTYVQELKLKRILKD